jgi:arylsulfatase A-like enzyme
VAYNATHWPYEAPSADRAHLPAPTSREGTHADYVAMLERADEGVGRVLATLDRLGLARTTLVVFTNDNGGEWLSRNAPLFNRKATLWEGGIRVPAIFRWPGHLPAGAVSHQVGITMDLTASFVAAAGVKPPPSYQPEGMDLLPVLAAGRTVERTLYWRALPPWYAQRAVRRGRWKYLRDGVNEFIFDVVADPGERHDLTGANRAMIPELRKLSQAWEKDVDASRAAASH